MDNSNKYGRLEYNVLRDHPMRWNQGKLIRVLISDTMKTRYSAVACPSDKTK